MAVTKETPAPYAPASAVLDLIKRYRNRGLASPVDAEVLARVGISKSLIPRTLQALVALDLIDTNSAPTKLFEGIRLAPEAEYKKQLQEWLRASYADVFAFVDPTKDGPTRIRDAFRSYQPTGQQDRMVTLFQGLCAEAGLLIVKEGQPKKERQSPAPTRTRARTKSAGNSATQLSADNNSSNSHEPKAPVGLPPALGGLLETLPPLGQGWTKIQRDRFINAFSVVLDYSIPIMAEDAKEAVA